MARKVTYSVSPRINPRDKDATPKFYGHVQASGDVSLREMAERIQQTCTVHKSDVFAVLVALEDSITDALQNGEIVRLGDLGSLQIGISSKGALSEDEYDESLIKQARINFRPGIGPHGNPHQPDLPEGEGENVQGGCRGGGSHPRCVMSL